MPRLWIVITRERQEHWDVAERVEDNEEGYERLAECPPAHRRIVTDSRWGECSDTRDQKTRIASWSAEQPAGIGGIRRDAVLCENAGGDLLGLAQAFAIDEQSHAAELPDRAQPAGLLVPPRDLGTLEFTRDRIGVRAGEASQMHRGDPRGALLGHGSGPSALTTTSPVPERRITAVHSVWPGLLSRWMAWRGT